LLEDPDLREAVVRESLERALEHLSFERIRSELVKFFDTLASKVCL
jgi:hypothetical protein